MRQDQAVRGIGWNALFTVLNKLLLPFLGFFIAARIGPAGLGIYAALNSLYVVIELFRDAGLAVTFVADQKIDEAREKTYQGLAFGSAIVFASLILLLRVPIAELFRAPEMADALILIAAGMLLTGFGSLSINKVYKQARFKEGGLIETAANLIGYAVAIALVFLHFGFMALIWQMFVRSLVHVLLAYRLAPVPFGRVDGGLAREILKQANSNLWANAAYTIYTMADYLLATRFFGQTANGHYAGAYNIANKPVDVIGGPIARTLFLAQSQSSDDAERASRIFARSLRAMAFIVVPIYLWLAFHAAGIVQFLYFGNPAFAAAAPLLQILTPYLGMRAFGTLSGGAIIAAKRAEITVRCWIAAYVVAGVGITLTLTQGWGLTGFVTSLTLGAVTVYGLYLIAALRLLKPERTLIQRFGQAVLGSAVVGLVAGVPLLFPIHPFAQLGLGILGVGLAQTLHVAWQLGLPPRQMLRKAGLKEALARM